jgi:hypothetical protein
MILTSPATTATFVGVCKLVTATAAEMLLKPMCTNVYVVYIKAIHAHANIIHIPTFALFDRRVAKAEVNSIPVRCVCIK